jgi:hypothetical protein
MTGSMARRCRLLLRNIPEPKKRNAKSFASYKKHSACDGVTPQWGRRGSNFNCRKSKHEAPSGSISHEHMETF